jgi:acetyl/propionyl-CoA carboxylase alpha subunit
VEGWSFDGEVEVFGVVDSFRHPGMSTFSRYQYPSSLPDAVQKEISELSRRVVRHVGYEGAPFNIEYFWDEASGRIWLLEVNARISQSHSELFAHVDGAANHAVPLDLALGRRPRMPHRQGKNPCAAKFYERTFEDSVVTRAPPPEELRALEDRVGACRIHVLVSEGMRLSDLGHQESYSFEMAWIYVGGRDEADLLRKHEQVLAGLDIRLEPVGRESA